MTHRWVQCAEDVFPGFANPALHEAASPMRFGKAAEPMVARVVPSVSTDAEQLPEDVKTLVSVRPQAHLLPPMA